MVLYSITITRYWKGGGYNTENEIYEDFEAYLAALKSINSEHLYGPLISRAEPPFFMESDCACEYKREKDGHETLITGGILRPKTLHEIKVLGAFRTARELGII